ncbi:MAG: hypothetical protein KC994_21455, partial [Candidatus Omnitrophica bacterium]|nr:hypothetical protein [Candidatus Omnitrophota bacterium]
YEIDGLQVYRVDEKYDSNSSSTITEADGWRIKDRRTLSPALIGGLLFKEVFTYPSDTSNANAESKVYYYGYDAQGNVTTITEEYCGGTAEQFIFTQDAFGNELTQDSFDGDSWDTARDDGIWEHQTGKWLDKETGLYFFHARWVDPVVGRFVGRTELNVFREQAYVFCENSPTARHDPNGVLSKRAHSSHFGASWWPFGDKDEPTPTPTPCTIPGQCGPGNPHPLSPQAPKNPNTNDQGEFGGLPFPLNYLCPGFVKKPVKWTGKAINAFIQSLINGVGNKFGCKRCTYTNNIESVENGGDYDPDFDDPDWGKK